MLRTMLIIAAVLTITGEAFAAADPDVLATLRKDHPRLLVLDDDVARVKRDVEHDATAKIYFDRTRAAADALLKAPPGERVLIGPRLLHISRQALIRTTTLGAMYRLTGEKKYADRCRDEMLAMAAFSDWNPSHFLDVAEMTAALGVGYDWIFDALPPEERKTIREAIVEKGLKPGLKVYASGKGFPKNTNNWNQVCNGGLTVGALAIADEEPDVARQIVESARDSILIAMKQFAPDGACIEGPGYWNYATRYTIYYLAALRTALGTDFGFVATPGFAETGMFRIQSIGPAMRTFNFADAGSNVGGASQMFWLARALDRPAYAAHERMILTKLSPRETDAFHLMWFEARGSDADVTKLPRTAFFGGVEVGFFRSAWNDPNAAFVGFKGGSNGASHAHLDLGSFVYDVDGVRWACDLGPDDYNLPGYFGKQRWDYYRLRTEGHNTITIDGENQKPKGKAAIVASSNESNRMFAIADLSDAYAEPAKRVRRGVRLLDRALIVQDELTADQPVEVIWHLHTEAKIEQASAGRAVLSTGKHRVAARIVSPADARFEIAPADAIPEVKADPPMGKTFTRLEKKLVVRLPAKVRELRLTVVLAPDAEEREISVEPLDAWSSRPPAADPAP